MIVLWVPMHHLLILLADDLMNNQTDRVQPSETKPWLAFITWIQRQLNRSERRLAGVGKRQRLQSISAAK